MIRPLLVLACTGALCACASYDTTAQSAYSAGRPASAILAPVTADYLLQADAADQFEIRSSRIALARALRPEVRDFAQMMIDHHTRSSATLKEAVLSLGITPTPAPLPTEALDRLALLDSVAASDFDAAYLDAQLVGHAQALALHRAYAQGGAVDPLRRVAENTAPLVEAHLARAEALSGR